MLNLSHARPALACFVLVALALLALAFAGCGGAARTPALGPQGTPRPGPPLNLIGFAPAGASVVLHTDLSIVRGDPVRYERIASELVVELGLQAEGVAVRGLLERADRAVGVMTPGAGGLQEGMLVFTGRFTDADFDAAIAAGSARHGGPPSVATGADGRRIATFGNAALVQFDTWTWAVAHGPGLRAHLAQVPREGARAFTRPLAEFGPRIGLPLGSAQAWANQDGTVGVDMVALVFAGENPQMVGNFVSTVRRHVGL
jgi:hypothetical protein